jgi:hypothetical protein
MADGISFVAFRSAKGRHIHVAKFPARRPDSCSYGASMNTHQRSTVVGVFEDRHHANQAVAELDEAGFDKSGVGIAMRHPGRPPDDLLAAKDTHAQAGALSGARASRET